jgi:heptosyltransferase-3
MKFLIIRTDRIGDVMLSLPVAQTLKEQLPDSKVQMMIREPIAALLAAQPFIDAVIPYKNGSLLNTIRSIRAHRFDTAILLHPTFPLSLGLFLARIPYRIGTGFRWYSFLFNRRVYEHRRPSEKHEIFYNVGMLKSIGIDEGPMPPTLIVRERDKECARALLESKNIDWKNFIVVHPGLGGSTLPWPEQSYAKLVSLLQERTAYGIVLTGTRSDFGNNRRIIGRNTGRAKNLAGMTNLTQLAALISLAKIIISVGTGPMHIASATQTPAVAFFPPSRVTSKTRWAPLTKALIFEPPVPYCQRCRREKCHHYNCMGLIKPEDVFEKMQEWLKNEIEK